MDYFQAREKLKVEYIKIGFELVEDSNDGLTFQNDPPSPSTKFVIPREDIENYAKNTNRISSDFEIIGQNCGIIGRNYREQIITIKAPGSHGTFEPEEISVNYYFERPDGSELIAEIGPASNFILDLLRFDDAYIDKCLKKIFKKLMMREIDYIYWNDIAYRPPTIKISDLKMDFIFRAKQKSSAIINSCIFAFAEKKRICLYPVEKFQNSDLKIDPLDYRPKINSCKIQIQMEALNPEMVRIYQRGVIAEDPFIKFLSFYQILEYCFQPNITTKLHNSIAQIIDQGVSPDTPEFIIKEIKKSKYETNEKNMIRQLLEEIISPIELIEFIDSYQNYLKDNIYNLRILGSTTVSNHPDLVVGHAANRIYQIRNALVHFTNSRNGKEKYVPNKINEIMLLQEIPLVQFLAEKAIYKFIH